ncbi:hypothetical protein LguiB_017464 [Lonicera macranthoides]
MIEVTKKHKKGSISEEDISTILQRYTATTVLALLQEVAQVQDVKIDWNELVKKSTTGISNAREYQMLWRHLAYRDALLERFDDGAQPLDDDSDLEYELEAFPTVSSEASTEAAACVKVLIASGLPSDSSLSNGSTVEAPLTINIPNSLSTRAASENSRGTNITVPVSVQTQSVEGLESNGSVGGNLPPRRKRKTWTEKEDEELIAAVQKCGEGNWANILKGDFKIDRTASQLSQRWAIIRKRKGNLNGGGGSQLSEVQLATRRAMSFALNMPMDNLKAASSIAATNSNTTLSICIHPTAAEAPSTGPQSQHLSQQDSITTVAQRTGTSGSLLKSRVTSKKPSPKSALCPDALVKAAAVAAGARIATPSDAASLLKAAQAKNAVHIMPGGGSMGNASPLSNPHLGPHPNVHYIRTGLAAPPLSTYSSTSPVASRPGGSQQVQVHAAKPGAAKVQSNATTTAPELNPSCEPTKNIGISSANAPKELVQKNNIALSVNAPKEQVQEDQVTFVGTSPKEQVQEDQASVSGNALKESIQEHQACVSVDASNKQVQEDKTALKSQMGFINSKCSSSAKTSVDDPMVGIGKQDTIKSENISKNMEICEDQSVNGEKPYLPSMSINGSDEKPEILGNAAAGSKTGKDVKRVSGLE